MSCEPGTVKGAIGAPGSTETPAMSVKQLAATAAAVVVGMYFWTKFVAGRV